MSYLRFKKEIAEKFCDFYSEQVDIFFEKAIELANKGKFKESIKIGKDAFVLSKFADIGYEKLYSVGMLCQAYLDSGQPEIADTFFKAGMEMINECEENYNDDVNSFLDIKILIEKEFEK